MGTVSGAASSVEFDQHSSLVTVHQAEPSTVQSPWPRGDRVRMEIAAAEAPTFRVGCATTHQGRFRTAAPSSQLLTAGPYGLSSWL